MKAHCAWSKCVNTFEVYSKPGRRRKYCCDACRINDYRDHWTPAQKQHEKTRLAMRRIARGAK